MAPRSLNTDSATQGQAAAGRSTTTASLGNAAAVAVPLILVAVLLPELLSAYWLRAFTSAAIFALAAAGVALLYGRLGLVSLAQVALLGLGAWVALRLSHATHLPFELVLLGGGIAAGFVGLVVGLPALRMRGLYLALITLMAAGGFQVIVGGTGFPDGGDGFLGRVTSAGARQLMARPWLAQSDAAYFRYVLVVAAMGFLLVALHRRTRPGRAWALIRKSEACALSAGVNVTLYKTWAFTLAGFLAGIAGGLLAGSVGQLDGRNFPASDSILLFALTVVGGAYSWFGPAITGLLFRAFPSLLTAWNVDGNLAFIVFGAALLHALITAPAGVAGQLSDLMAGLHARFKQPDKEQGE